MNTGEEKEKQNKIKTGTQTIRDSYYEEQTEG